MTDHDRLRAVGIVWGCILTTLLVYGCAERPVLGDPNTLTRSWISQTWPGYETPKITIYDNTPPQYFGAESARLARLGDDYFIFCRQTCSRQQIEHEEAHALADYNGKPDEWHETDEDRDHILAILRHGDAPLGDTRYWWALDPVKVK